MNLIDNGPLGAEVDAYAATCEELDLAWLANTPLVKGILMGKFTADSRLTDDDVHRRWDFRDGPQAAQLRALARVRGALKAGGRSLAQAALAWIWARSDRTIPIPGFKTVAQIEELAGAAQFGPLSGERMAEIQSALGG
jgi:aryl-alcohol dehydrogenase-like predicted oxidoreductase